MKRFFRTFVIILVLISSTMGVKNVSADEKTVISSGSCGEDVTYTIYDDYSMVISGTGSTYDYESGKLNKLPFYMDYSSKITSITIEQGITRIGDYVFHNM